MYTDIIKDKNSIEYDGTLYCLIDGNTASSAAYFASVIQESKLGILVGSNTMPESVGDDASMYILPKSKLLLRINDELTLTNNTDFKNNEQITNGTIYPDILVNSNLKNKLNCNTFKYDNCINTILKMEMDFK